MVQENSMELSRTGEVVFNLGLNKTSLVIKRGSSKSSLMRYVIRVRLRPASLFQ